MKSRKNIRLHPMITAVILTTSLVGCASNTEKASVEVEEACHQHRCNDETELPEVRSGKSEKSGNNGIKKMIRKDKAIPGLYHPVSDQRPLHTSPQSHGSINVWP